MLLFLYPHLAEAWRAAGAELLPFSPLNDEAPSQEADMCWLPGGYPELHAGKIAASPQFLDGLRVFAQTKPVHGECGGYMVLGEALEDKEGVTHRMSGLLGHTTSFAKRKMNLGYRRATLLSDAPMGTAGTVLNGHEFHYSRMTIAGNDDPLTELTDANGRDLGHAGSRRGQVSGCYFHMIDCG